MHEVVGAILKSWFEADVEITDADDLNHLCVAYDYVPVLSVALTKFTHSAFLIAKAVNTQAYNMPRDTQFCGVAWQVSSIAP